jgi:hypothetical protein
MIRGRWQRYGHVDGFGLVVPLTAIQLLLDKFFHQNCLDAACASYELNGVKGEEEI